MSRYVLGFVRRQFVAEAYEFHRRCAGASGHIWARSLDEFKQLVRKRTVYGARNGSGRLVALCYSRLDKEQRQFEIGGLFVDAQQREIGIGWALAGMTLAQTVALAQPWNPKAGYAGYSIVAHVHDGNGDPVGMLERMGFRYSRKVRTKDADAPPDMTRDSEGMVTSDCYEFPQESLPLLGDWFNEMRNMHVHNVEFVFDLKHGATLDTLQSTLQFRESYSSDETGRASVVAPAKPTWHRLVDAILRKLK